VKHDLDLGEFFDCFEKWKVSRSIGVLEHAGQIADRLMVVYAEDKSDTVHGLPLLKDPPSLLSERP
jgi:hypothetical protein